MLIRLRIGEQIMDPFICGILWDLLNDMMDPTPAGSHIFWITIKDFSGTCLTKKNLTWEGIKLHGKIYKAGFWKTKSTKQVIEHICCNSVLLICVLEINLHDLGITTWAIVF